MVRRKPLAGQVCCDVLYQGGHEPPHVLMPKRNGLIGVKVTCARTLRHQPYYGVVLGLGRMALWRAQWCRARTRAHGPVEDGSI